jgi:hypothetical protein
MIYIVSRLRVKMLGRGRRADGRGEPAVSVGGDHRDPLTGRVRPGRGTAPTRPAPSSAGDLQTEYSR